MPAHLESLETILQLLAALDKEQFNQGYAGIYLVAMGLLSSEEIVARKNLGAMAQGGDDPETTVPMKFGLHPKHDLRQAHPLAGKAFHLPPPTAEEYLTLGRGSRCAIVVPDESVSDEHCRVQVLKDALVVADLGSTNGTSVNLHRLGREQVELVADGDMLTLGRYSFQMLLAPTLYSTLALIRALDS
jgi:hypothetical protein